MAEMQVFNSPAFPYALSNREGETMKDSRIGMRCQLHPATDRWMKGDRYGEIVAVSKRVRSYLDPKDPRNGRVFTVLLDKSQKRVRFSEGNILEVFSKNNAHKLNMSHDLTTVRPVA